VRSQWTSVSTLRLLVVGLAVPLAAQQGPCDQVTAACKSAGFVDGGVGTGIGLQKDCVFPIMQGIAQPAAATRQLPQIDPQVVAACKARHPDFGQGKGPTTAAQIQALPGADLPLATHAPPPAPTPTGASTVTHLPATSLPALTAPAPGTGSIAVEMETSSGAKTPLGNAISVTDNAAQHGVLIRFGTGNQQAMAVQTCHASSCILSHVIITQTARSPEGVRTPTVVYTLSNSTVSAVFQTPCAAPSTAKPCAGALQAMFTYENINVEYPSH
jgi:hypothetical protein